jgi:hypothetical protein
MLSALLTLCECVMHAQHSHEQMMTMIPGVTQSIAQMALDQVRTSVYIQCIRRSIIIYVQHLRLRYAGRYESIC